jgi:hypothetical protein
MQQMRFAIKEQSRIFLDCPNVLGIEMSRNRALIGNGNPSSGVWKRSHFRATIFIQEMVHFTGMVVAQVFTKTKVMQFDDKYTLDGKPLLAKFHGQHTTRIHFVDRKCGH